MSKSSGGSVTEFRHPLYHTLAARAREARRFIQVLSGPRQVGKTTLAEQVLADYPWPAHRATADSPTLEDTVWIEVQWDIARSRATRKQGGLLVLDEIQKIPRWSEVVKRLWDEDTTARRPLRVLLLGSSPLLVQRGLTESLAGRFETLSLRQWSYAEMRAAFGWDLEHTLYFGGYPGAASLVDDRDRWARYIMDSLVETTLSRDILLMTRIDKPALLRRLFQLGCDYSGQVLSYQKMVGQLQDAGNTTTLAHYLDVLAGAGLLVGLQKFAGQRVRQRGSSPKLQVLDTSFMTAASGMDFEAARADREFWGRLVESAVGAHLFKGSFASDLSVFYWRERNAEVDFVLRSKRRTVAIEVKSTRRRTSLQGMEVFAKTFRPGVKLLIGGQGLRLEEFFAAPASQWLQA